MIDWICRADDFLNERSHVWFLKLHTCFSDCAQIESARMITPSVWFMDYYIETKFTYQNNTKEGN